MTWPGGSSRLKSSNTTCRTKHKTSLEWEEEGGKKGGRERKEEGKGGRWREETKCCHLLWSSGIGELDIFKFHSSFNMIGWNGGAAPQWDGGVQGHVLKHSCSSSCTSHHLTKQDGESPHGPEGGSGWEGEGREGEGRGEKVLQYLCTFEWSEWLPKTT